MQSPFPRRASRKADGAHVRDLLRVMVLSERTVAKGQALPTESELMLEFGTSRNVVREALGLLRDEGVVERLPGAGTFVVSEKIPHRFDVLHGAGEGFPNRALRMRGVLGEVVAMRAPALVAGKLDLEPGGPCVKVDAWVGFDDAPFSLATSYLPARFGPQLEAAVFSGDWYELVESFGVVLGPCAMDLEAIVADEMVADWLDVPPGAPLVLFTRTLRDSTGDAVEYGFIRVRADRLLLSLGLVRGPYEPAPVPTEEEPA